MDAKKVDVSYGHIYSPKFIRENKDIFDPEKNKGFSLESGILALVYEGFGVDIHLNEFFMNGYKVAGGCEKTLGHVLTREVKQELSASMSNLKKLTEFIDSGNLQSDLYFSIKLGRCHLVDYWIRSSGEKLSVEFLKVIDKINMKLLDPKHADIVGLKKHLCYSTNGDIPDFVGNSLNEASGRALNFYNRIDEVREFVRLAR